MMASPIALVNKRKLSTGDIVEASGEVDLQWQGVDFKYFRVGVERFLSRQRHSDREFLLAGAAGPDRVCCSAPNVVVVLRAAAKIQTCTKGAKKWTEQVTPRTIKVGHIRRVFYEESQLQYLTVLQSLASPYQGTLQGNLPNALYGLGISFSHIGMQKIAARIGIVDRWRRIRLVAFIVGIPYFWLAPWCNPCKGMTRQPCLLPALMMKIQALNKTIPCYILFYERPRKAYNRLSHGGKTQGKSSIQHEIVSSQ